MRKSLSALASRGSRSSSSAAIKTSRALVDQAVADGADALGMAGGDGSLGVVAAAAYAHELPFVCIPAGTRNHFARDLGLDPSDPAGCLEAFDDAVEGRTDLGEVNGRLFLNLVSLGVYGEAVQRPRYRDAKARTLLETARAVLGESGAVPEVNLVDDRGPCTAIQSPCSSPNNPYSLEHPMSRGARPRLDTGRLGIIVIDAPTGGRHPPGRAWSESSLEVGALSTVHAGVDGEAVEIAPPVRFSIQPRALRVRVPRRNAAQRRPPRPARPRRR